MLTWLAENFPVHRGERLCVSVLFGHYFLVSAAVIAGKAARDAFFLSRYDKSILPLMYLMNAICVTLAMIAFSRVMKRLKHGAGAALILGFFSLTLLLIALKLDGLMVAVLYVWMEVIGAVVVLQSWLMTGNAFDPRQAKRLFGVIAAGGSIAAWAGGSSVAWAVARFGSSSLIKVVALVLALSMSTAWYASRFQAARPRSRPAVAGHAGARRKLSPYVVSIAILIAATSMVSAIVQYRFQVASVVAYPNRDQLVAFFGHFYAWTGAASLGTQLFLSSFLLSRFGVVAGLFVLPACFSIGSIFTVVSPSLWTAGFGRFSDLTFKFTVHNSSLEMLWLPVPPEERQAVKPLVSGTLKAVSEASTAILMFTLVKFSPPWVLSAVALAMCGVWVLTVLKLRGQYRQALVSVIEKRQLDAEALRLSVTDPIVVESINRGLRSPDEAEQIAALALLDGWPLQAWTTALHHLLVTGSPEIRERLFVLAANDRSILADETVLATCEAGGALGRTAIEVAADREITAVPEVLARLVDSADTSTSIAAASAIFLHKFGEADRARVILTRWLESADPGAIRQVLRLVPCDSTVLPRAKLSSLLEHPNTAVRCAALESVAARKDTTLLRETVAALADTRCVRTARLALRTFPADVVVQSLVEAVNNTGNEQLRRAALRMLRELPQAVPEGKVAAQMEPDDLKTYAEFADLLRAVKNVRPVHADVVGDALLHCADIRTEAYLCDAVTIRLHGDADAILLRDHVARRYSLAVGTILRLTALQHPEFPVEACMHAANSGDSSMVPYLIEVIETTVTGENRRLLAPLVDASQIERRQAILRELFKTPEVQIDARIQKAASSRDGWEAMVATDYLARKSKLTTAATVSGHVMTVQEHNMYSTLEKTIILKSSDVFGGLPAENLATLAAIADEVRSPTGAVLFKDGEAGDCLYMVICGSVRIVKGGSEIAVLGKGACFGEMAVLDQAPRSADAVVIDEAVLLRIGSEEFYDVLAENPALTQGIVRMLTRRLRDANARIAKAEC